MLVCSVSFHVSEWLGCVAGAAVLPFITDYIPPLLSNVAPTNSIVFYFNEDVKHGHGTFTILDDSLDVVTQVLDVRTAIIQGNRVTFNINQLEGAKKYHILISANSFYTHANHAYVGIQDSTWTFTTSGLFLLWSAVLCVCIDQLPLSYPRKSLPDNFILCRWY